MQTEFMEETEVVEEQREGPKKERSVQDNEEVLDNVWWQKGTLGESRKE